MGGAGGAAVPKIEVVRKSFGALCELQLKKAFLML